VAARAKAITPNAKLVVMVRGPPGCQLLQETTRKCAVSAAYRVGV
jgi:hypothetical protein